MNVLLDFFIADKKIIWKYTSPPAFVNMEVTVRLPVW